MMMHSPPNPMILTIIDGDEVWLERREWEVWMDDGRIPGPALVQTSGGWIPAHQFDVFRRTEREEAKTPPPPTPNVLKIIFPKKGVSATEAILLVNILVFGFLVIQWGQRYESSLYALLAGWWHEVHDRNFFWWWWPPTVMHVSPQHLFGNAVSILFGAGAIEVLMGARWVFILYPILGFGSSFLSYLGHDGAPLSVGASGVAFGFWGVLISFLIRHRSKFTDRQRWKAKRVYVGMIAIMVLPALLNADYFGHVGGFVMGLLVGGLLPLHSRFSRPSPTDETEPSTDMAVS